jgi:hypothetical protein
MGTLDGRGGGGGPGAAPDTARGRPRTVGGWANLPASAIGGGALNLSRGGDGSLGGAGAGVSGS